MKTRTKYSKLFLITISFLSIASTCFAIPASFGSATHRNPKWQELATYDSNNQLVDQYGIFWSVDNGANWGRDVLQVGQTVQFQFNMHKRHAGTHYADFLKVWLDWDQSGVFEQDESIFYAEQLLSGNMKPNGRALDSEANYTYYSNFFTIDASHVGDLWLRGRVVCSESLLKSAGIRGPWSQQWDEPHISSYSEKFNPTGHLYQGEVEEWKMQVNQVPDAGATVALLGGALTCLGVIRRRMGR